MTDLRPLGSPDLLVSAVGLGCNNFGRPGFVTETLPATKAVLDAAIDHGVTFLDTAAMYGSPAGTSESLMGEALRGRRDEVVLATKFGHRGGGPEGAEGWGARGAATYVDQSVEGSLRRLQTDRIDLFQMHTPDEDTPIGETLEALARHVEAGRVRFIGHSNFTAEQISEADAVAAELGLPRFVSAQDQYSLLARGVEADVLPAVREHGLGFLPYFPLHNGLLTGKYSPTSGDGRLRRVRPEVLENTDWDQLDAYRRICDDAGVTMLQATFAWLLAQGPVSSVIAGATTPEQVAANAEAGRTRLDQETLDAISRLFA